MNKTKSKEKGKAIIKYVVIGILILSMVGSVFAYLFAALQSI